MKQPRVIDFDPNATTVPVLGSPLDQLPTIERPRLAPATDGTDGYEVAARDASRESEPPQAVQAVPVPGSMPVPLVPPVQSVQSVPLGRGVPLRRRPIKQRHPFDIYADQLDTLRDLALEERKLGGMGSMSAMVREALDDFIAKRTGLAATAPPQ